MRKLTWILCLALFFPAFARAQQFALYRSGLLVDAANNPYQTGFSPDDESHTAIGFLNVASFTQFTNSAGKFAANYNFSELLDAARRDKILGLDLTDGRSSLNSRSEFYTFQLRFRLNIEKNRELSITNSTVGEAKMYMSNNLLRLMMYGNKPYVGDNLNKTFDMGLYMQAYNKTSIGYRWDMNSKLSLGVNLNIYQGIVNGKAKLEQTGFFTAPGGDSITLKYNGSANYSTGFDAAIIDPIRNSNSASDIGKQLTKGLKPGLGMSIGAAYKINDKFSATFAMKDWGYIRWEKSSTNYSLQGQTSFKGYNVVDSSFFKGNVQDILKRMGSYANDSSKGSYSTRIIPTFEIGGQYKWTEKLQNRLVVTRQGYIKNYQFSLITDLTLYRKLHAVLNMGVGTLRNQMVGASIYYLSKHFQTYIGSEQISNATLKNTNLGLDAYFGFGFRW